MINEFPCLRIVSFILIALQTDIAEALDEKKEKWVRGWTVENELMFCCIKKILKREFLGKTYPKNVELQRKRLAPTIAKRLYIRLTGGDGKQSLASKSTFRKAKTQRYSQTEL